MSQKAILMILDGWGIAQSPELSAVDNAKTPFIDSCYDKFAHTTLEASGLKVGLPDGQMGNSEVGHLNLGAGRIVHQNLVKINLAVENDSLKEEKVLKQAFSYVKEKGSKLHFMGLVSDGGVHSHINHLKGLVKAANDFGVENTFVHAFTDGRDCPPESGKKHLQNLMQSLEGNNAKLASVIGRYYAMDRDKRWERVSLAYDAMVNAKGKKTQDVISEIEKSYKQGVTDEFIKPIILTDDKGAAVAKIEENDCVVCFNFRTDRGRQISEVLTQKDFPDFEMKKLNLHYVTMTQYDETFKDVNVVFGENVLQNTMGEVLEAHGKTQVRIAETEKYPHVTFFFSGGREKEFNGEKRLLCPSPKDVATYDLKPEMSAYDIKDAIVKEMNAHQPDFVCLNFANPDMVGHTGVMEAAIKACEVVDECAKEVTETALENDYKVFILADHGNSDQMINPDGSVNTQHTTHPVPLIVAGIPKDTDLKPGKLGDIAPTILNQMGVEIPSEMTGDILI